MTHVLPVATVAVSVRASAYGIAVSFGLVQLLTLAAMTFHLDPLVIVGVLLVASARPLVSRSRRRSRRRGTIVRLVWSR